ncbi:hypothetical protein [Methylobacterium aquaticum]|uniref:hypothetical protein n=1 Tax=Methylobacterium aquaticum TaxID=270351 RepID=UPI0019349FC4|nr:hypothetical protein [Methylobacterium aquaticum]QRE72729.1 hypothetical protein F1D61_02750 [Methylobacterium aquaticum]
MRRLLVSTVAILCGASASVPARAQTFSGFSPTPTMMLPGTIPRLLRRRPPPRRARPCGASRPWQAP